MAVEIGIVLPTYGAHASPEGVLTVARAAAELGFGSVWASEHLLVGPEVPDRYTQVFDPLTTLGWVAGQVADVALGTSILILPLHNPVEVAKEVASLQQLSGGRVRLAVGVGWYEREFSFLGHRFDDRGDRADEALDVIRALWNGAERFSGSRWSFDDVRFAPLPDPPPPVWIGGNSAAARRRAAARGDAWHPTSPDPDTVRRGREELGDLPIVPRYSVALDGDGAPVAGPPAAVADQLRQRLEAGADGFVLRFGLHPDVTVDAMRRFAGEVLPRLAD
ncbi:MAG: TIGR03619 family F420-dependent LLM class oxidoreductase [Actinomycetota bacterium]|nr:TIGR03619 family F420-dependent LLM class oxidoreductase [Actinomycetota bacterium]